MIVTFLGTGTSDGIPVIGCECEVCLSKNPKNKRTRSSLLIHYTERNIIIDTSPELRLQSLACSVKELDAILYTHTHADHVRGLDDIRVFNRRKGGAIPCYGKPEAVADIRNQFSYIFTPTQQGGGKPLIDLVEVNGPFDLFGKTVLPLPVKHGTIDILGYRIEDFAYVTDASQIPAKTKDMTRNLEVLVINALRQKPHSTHFSIDQALEIVEELAPQQAFLTHLSHRIEHDLTEKTLPAGVHLAFDGLSLKI